MDVYEVLNELTDIARDNPLVSDSEVDTLSNILRLFIKDKLDG